MTFPRVASAARYFPKQVEFHSALVKAMVVVFGSSLLWASAKVQLPLWPVPVTMQTYAVLLLGPLLGWRLGAAAVLTYLAEGAIGLPVFAAHVGNGLGLEYLYGPTGGYLAGYVAAVVLVGALAEHGWDRSIPARCVSLLAGELVILTLGCGWLAIKIGWGKALVLGVFPFLFGDALKLVMAVGTLSVLKLRLKPIHM
jgi:biotin transport system substrate-specific component